MFYNLFLPGGIGGDGYKIYLLQKNYQTGTKKIFGAVLADRISGMVALVVLALIGVSFLNPENSILFTVYNLQFTIFNLAFILIPFVFLAYYLLHQMHLSLLSEDKPGHLSVCFCCTAAAGGLCLVSAAGTGRTRTPPGLYRHLPCFIGSGSPAHIHRRGRRAGTDLSVWLTTVECRY